MSPFVGRDGQKYFRANHAVEIAVDAIEIASSIQRLVLVPGDDDFTALADALQRKGIRFSVLSTMKGEKPMVSNQLRRSADEFLEMADLLPRIGREPG